MSTSPYPVHVAAELDTGLTRWLWLVKWLLASRTSSSWRSCGSASTRSA